MSSIFGRFAVILLSSVLVVVLGANFYQLFTNMAPDGYYSYVGFGSILKVFETYNTYIQNSWFSFNGMINSLRDAFNFNIFVGIISALTWVIPYFFVCVVANMVTFIFVLVQFIVGDFTFTLPHIYNV